MAFPFALVTTVHFTPVTTVSTLKSICPASCLFLLRLPLFLLTSVLFIQLVQRQWLVIMFGARPLKRARLSDDDQVSWSKPLPAR
jgi:hypothetical protein